MTTKSASPQQTLPGVGDTLGQRFVLLQRLGRGRHGTSFLAQHQLTQQHFVLKVFHPSLSEAPHFIEWLTAITSQDTKATHPSMVRRYLPDRCTRTGWVYQPSERATGTNLQEQLDSLSSGGGCLTEEEVLQILQGLAGILGDLHRQGLHHNNIKPSNLFLRKEKSSLQLSLSDLGYFAPPQGSTLSGPSSLFDKVFRSPQQQSNPTQGTISDDVYALGVTLYTLLAGHPPELRTNTTPPPLGKIRPEIEKVLFQAFHYREDVRTSSIHSLLHGFRAALDNSQAPAHALQEYETDEIPFASEDVLQASSPKEFLHTAEEPTFAPSGSEDSPSAYEPSILHSPNLRSSDAAGRAFESTPCQGMLVMEHPVRSVSLHPSGSRLAINCAPQAVLVWETASWEQLCQIELPVPNIRRLGWHPNDPNLLILCTNPQHLLFWDIATQQEVINFQHSSTVLDWVVDTEAQTLYVVTADRMFHRWDLRSYNLQQSWPVSDGIVHTLALNQASEYLIASVGLGKVQFTGLHAGKSHTTKRVDGDYVDGLCAHPSQPMLFTGHGNGSVQSWNLNNMSLNKMMYGHSDRILSIHVAAHADVLATLAADQSIRVWSASHGLHLETILLSSQAETFGLAPHGEWLLAPQRQSIHIWSLQDLGVK